jgi:Uma2 family endonuclease
MLLQRRNDLESDAMHVRRLRIREDLVNLPEIQIGEIVDGELHASPRPSPRHAAAETAIGDTLRLPFHRGRGGPGGWQILIEPELHLGPDVLVADWAGWRRIRMPSVPKTAYLPLAPDWVCEVLSPSTASLGGGSGRALRRS